jgi:hypothetical protein
MLRFEEMGRGGAVLSARVHYPRTRPEQDPGTHAPAPDPEGRSYAWFVANERANKEHKGRSLPSWHEPQLPYYSDRPQQQPPGPQPRHGSGPRTHKGPR